MLFIVLICVLLVVATAFRSPLVSQSKISAAIRKSSLAATITDDKIGFDSHIAVDKIPDTLVRSTDGNDSMRRKFERLVRNAQVS